MDRLYNFVRSDLFLSLAGGFALGLVCEWIVREEVARMLSGAKVTDAARAQADELLGARG
mgnify:CR=1 FL=1